VFGSPHRELADDLGRFCGFEVTGKVLVNAFGHVDPDWVLAPFGLIHVPGRMCALDIERRATEREGLGGRGRTGRPRRFLRPRARPCAE